VQYVDSVFCCGIGVERRKKEGFREGSKEEGGGNIVKESLLFGSIVVYGLSKGKPLIFLFFACRRSLLSTHPWLVPLKDSSTSCKHIFSAASSLTFPLFYLPTSCLLAACVEEAHDDAE